LEKIRVDLYLELFSIHNSVSNAVDALKSLKLKAGMSFPKLVETELIVRTANLYENQSATASFRTGDAFITLRNKGNTYRLFDGPTDFVGAYFGQAVDCADCVYPWTHLEVP